MSVVGRRFGWRLPRRVDEARTKDGHMSMMVQRMSQAHVQGHGQTRHGRKQETTNVGGASVDGCHSSAQDASDLAVWWQVWRSRGCRHAFSALIEHYMHKHVRPIAERLRATLPCHVDVDDLMQQGYLGLKEAMERFDPDQGVRFETFSSRRVSGAMQDWLRALDHVPRLMRRRHKVVQHEVDRFRVSHGRNPDDKELRDALATSPAECDRIIGEASPPVIMTISTVSGDDDDPMAVPEQRTTLPSARIQRRDLRDWITRDLDAVDALIVSMYYYESLTMREIGAAVGCSESRVSQRLDSILQRLRARIDLRPEDLELRAG